jgi:hypothetical protein
VLFVIAAIVFWHARKANDISFLIQHLDMIVRSLNCVDEVASFQPVPADQLFTKRPRSGRRDTDG